MAAINFVKGEQYYTAEFQIKGPVNVHIERAEAGALYFRQRSIDHGSYDLINGANWNNRGDLTIDTAIQGVVYPMWIKIESASEPTLAEMVEGESSGGGAGTADSGDWEYYKVDSSFNTLKEEELTTLENVFKDFGTIYYMGSVSDGALLPKLYFAYGTKFQGFKAKGEGVYFETFKSIGLSTFKSLGEEPFASEMNTSAGLPFFNALIPCTKEEFESLITK